MTANQNELSIFSLVPRWLAESPQGSIAPSHAMLALLKYGYYLDFASCVHMLPCNAATGHRPGTRAKRTLTLCTASTVRSNLCLSNVVQQWASKGLPCASTTGRPSQGKAGGEKRRSVNKSDVAHPGLLVWSTMALVRIIWKYYMCLFCRFHPDDRW